MELSCGLKEGNVKLYWPHGGLQRGPLSVYVLVEVCMYWTLFLPETYPSNVTGHVTLSFVAPLKECAEV